MPHDAIEIGPPLPVEMSAALELAWRHIAEPQRAEQIRKTLDQWRDQLDPLAELLVARRRDAWGSHAGKKFAEKQAAPAADRAAAGELLAAIWAQRQPGGAALVSPPGVNDKTAIDGPESDKANTAIADRLLEGLLDRLAETHVELAQALLPLDHGDDFDLLRRHGFEHVADLLYMVSLARAFPDAPPAAEITLDAYTESQAGRMAALVERTYEATRDCPRLNGMRRTDDVLAGYRATGEFDPARWFFLRHDGQDVGCLLLANHPAHRQWELVYIGLAVEFRGRGWGVQAVRQAQFLAGRSGATCLLLAVDADNEPAIAMYAASGFAGWDRRSVLVRFLACHS